VNERESKSGSENAEAEANETRLPVLSERSPKLEATGGRLAALMVQENEPEAVPPRPSATVTETVYGLEVLAEERTVPETNPVADIASPGGRLVAEKERESLSGSENEEASDRLTMSEIPEVLAERVPATGLRLGGRTVQVNEAATVPPLPSLAVTRVAYGLPVAAVEAMVPEISPAEDIARPAGRPVAVNERVSLLGSENEPATLNDTGAPAEEVRPTSPVVTTGGSFTSRTTHSSVPTLPS